jgi:hypothetical protein
MDDCASCSHIIPEAAGVFEGFARKASFETANNHRPQGNDSVYSRRMSPGLTTYLDVYIKTSKYV